MMQRSASKLRTSGITVVISLSLVLFMLGLMGYVLINARQISNHVKENIGFQILLKDTATSAQIDGLIQEINTSKYAKSVELTSKEKAAEQLKADLGEDFITFLGSNPLLAALQVKLNADYAQTDTLQAIERQLIQKPFVKEVVYQKDMIKNFNQNARGVTFFILIFSGALLIIAIALIINTIRLSIYSQRFLIRTMYLVGATKTFISRPFILKGLRQGIIAAIIASALLVGFLALSTRFIPDLLKIQDETLLFILFASILVGGMIISGLSSFISVMRYLRLKTSDLYF
ncbi:MAG: permease-like cell division protein FtsX [Sediminibacterium sp.]|nr:permease-like cell division protein FtsX [Sediminibacterium sp.]